MANLTPVRRTGEPITETSYERLAEFHDLFMAEPWERLRPQVQSAFAHLVDAAVLVEIGAGTGIGTRIIAAESGARIAALEPALVMRSILTARVADDPDLAARVTVIAGSAPADFGLLPPRVDAFACVHMLGHLDRADRQRLFGWLGAHLTDDGVGLVTTQPEPNGERATVVRTRRLGDYEYRVHHFSSGSGHEYSSRYEVLKGDVVVREETFTGTWHVVTAEEVAADLPPTLALEPAGDGVALVRRTGMA